MAAGARLSLPNLTAPTTSAAAGYLAGGAALYLLGLALFRVVLGFGSPWLRAGAGMAALATVPVGTGAGAAQQLGSISAVLVVLLLVEWQGSGRGVLVDRAG